MWAHGSTICCQGFGVFIRSCCFCVCTHVTFPKVTFLFARGTTFVGSPRRRQDEEAKGEEEEEEDEEQDSY